MLSKYEQAQVSKRLRVGSLHEAAAVDGNSFGAATPVSTIQMSIQGQGQAQVEQLLFHASPQPASCSGWVFLGGAPPNLIRSKPSRLKDSIS